MASLFVKVRNEVYSRYLGPFQDKVRRVRMRDMLQRMDIAENARVLDLGGTPSIWRFVDRPLDVTILNLPGSDQPDPGETVHTFRFVEGDATNVSQYEDRSFDFVFSNSVIEHVGGVDKQQSFAQEVRRLSEKYWVQTPSIWFPIEAHTGMPFWFFFPESLRRHFIEKWRPQLPAWTQMVEETTIISKRSMAQYFPDAKVITEHKFGIPKSYTAYKA